MPDLPSAPARRLVTSALPYANGPLHLGHLAGAYLPADVYVRYLRSSEQEVVWVCGSDEHGAAISMRAKKEGRSEQEIIDTYHELHRDAFASFGVSFDIYHRTSSELHHQTAQELFVELIKKGDQFEKRLTEQYYDETFGSFLADRFIQGTCPNCGSDAAYGDQCENCGKDLSPLDLVEPRSTLSGAKPVLRETSHWYFRLDQHEGWLRSYIAEGKVDGVQHHNPQLWRNHVTGQCLSWLDAGLQPRAYTRDLDWGIPVPSVPEYIKQEAAAGKVLYVWFDAPIGYISATKQWAIDQGQPDLWKQYWQDDTTELIHFIGKDNIVFHCLTFQATLKALGNYNVAAYVPANQFLNFEGDKFSKSRGWGITMDEYLEAFAGFPNHVDAMRYALMRNAPETSDSDFKWDEFVAFHDKELADKLGNFINRVLSLTHKYFGGKVPDGKWDFRLEGIIGEGGNAASLTEILTIQSTRFERFHLKTALEFSMGLIDWANADLQARAPWTLAKADQADPGIADALYVAAQMAAMARVLFEPFIPETAQKLADLLQLPELGFAKAKTLLECSEPLLAPGTQLGEPTILFAKIQDRNDTSRLHLIEAQKAQLAKIMAEEAQPDETAPATPEEQQSPLSPEINYDDFAKLDIRTARIVSAEAVPKADKLLKLELDLGFERRTVVSGIALHFKCEDLPGKEVLVLANLAPRKLRGVESKGMILMADQPEGGLAFVAPPAGSALGMRVS